MKYSITVLMMAVFALLNAQTTKSVAVPGTRVSMVPVTGYKLAETFYGFQKNSTTGIQVYDLSGRSYYEAINGFTIDELTAKGAVVFILKQVVVDGYEARYAVMQGDSATKIITLLFGDSTFTVMLMAPYANNESAQVEKQIEQSLLSAKYNKTAKVDPFALSYFKLIDTNSKYKYAKTANDNIYVYSLNGEVKDSYMGETALTAMPIHSDTVLNAEAVATAVLDDMKKYGLNEAETTYKSSKPINGFNAYETITYGNVAKQKHAVYHMVVAKGNKGFIVQGIALGDFEINVQQFEALAHTVAIK